MMTETLYASRVERIYDRVLRGRMTNYLEKIAQALRDAAYEVSEPYDLTDDEYRWSILVEGNGLPEAIDVSLELAESMSYGDETAGVNLRLSIVSYGGRVLGDLTPYNYTPECWAPLDDLHEVVRRMEIIEQADVGSVIWLVDKYAVGT